VAEETTIKIHFEVRQVAGSWYIRIADSPPATLGSGPFECEADARANLVAVAKKMTEALNRGERSDKVAISSQTREASAAAPLDIEALQPNPNAAWDKYDSSDLPDLPDVIWIGKYQRIGNDRRPLRALVAVALGYGDTGNWLSLSVKRFGTEAEPTWHDALRARNELGYGDRLFVRVAVPHAEAGLSINLLHRLDGDTIPHGLSTHFSKYGRL
jgi:hypothetical protein